MGWQVCEYFRDLSDVFTIEVYQQIPRKNKKWNWRLVKQSSVIAAGSNQLYDSPKQASMAAIEYINAHFAIGLTPING